MQGVIIPRHRIGIVGNIGVRIEIFVGDVSAEIKIPRNSDLKIPT